MDKPGAEARRVSHIPALSDSLPLLVPFSGDVQVGALQILHLIA